MKIEKKLSDTLVRLQPASSRSLAENFPIKNEFW